MPVYQVPFSLNSSLEIRAESPEQARQIVISIWKGNKLKDYTNFELDVWDVSESDIVEEQYANPINE
ncbi:hypothetical protein P9246_10755 [Aeribacillus pallidus]|uniref:hypothetical protein n=1 Tax=Aeribacillus composti TaxID=1868734 RepID=UPI002E221387|nr:hypothetical protein [Aeribacillus composti]MED4487220.1 hypothetical protein [Aeribacillus pallidus]